MACACGRDPHQRKHVDIYAKVFRLTLTDVAEAMMKARFLGFLAAGLLAGFATPASAALLFESSAATASSPRGAGSSILTRFEVSAAAQLTNIAVEMDLARAGNLNFVIFNSSSGALLFQSGSQAFADDGMAFKLSDLLAFTLNPGTRYAIGAMADVDSRQNFVRPGGLTVGAITSLGGNQNASGFLSPTFNDFLNSTDGRVRLYGSIGVTAVPEPDTVALVGLGLAGVLLGAARRRRTN
jgi:hypothetical protein